MTLKTRYNWRNAGKDRLLNEYGDIRRYDGIWYFYGSHTNRAWSDMWHRAEIGPATQLDTLLRQVEELIRQFRIYTAMKRTWRAVVWFFFIALFTVATAVVLHSTLNVP